MSQHKVNPTLYSSQEIDNESYDDTHKVKLVAPVGYDVGSDTFKASPLAFMDKAFDYIGFSNADTNGNYQTWLFKTGGSSGTTVRTLSVTYDASSKITSIARS